MEGFLLSAKMMLMAKAVMLMFVNALPFAIIYVEKGERVSPPLKHVLDTITGQ